MWRGGLDCCALHLQSIEGTMNDYAENPKITLRVSIGDACLLINGVNDDAGESRD